MQRGEVFTLTLSRGRLVFEVGGPGHVAPRAAGRSFLSCEMRLVPQEDALCL